MHLKENMQPLALAKYLTRRAFIHTRPLYSLYFVISILLSGSKMLSLRGTNNDILVSAGGRSRVMIGQIVIEGHLRRRSLYNQGQKWEGGGTEGG